MTRLGWSVARGADASELLEGSWAEMRGERMKREVSAVVSVVMPIVEGVGGLGISRGGGKPAG